MTTLRFVHSSDIHVGRTFSRYRDGSRLTDSRHGSILRLAEVARDHDARHVLVAGDLFETPNPAPSTWRQAIAAMAEAAELTWWLLPGNHDNLTEAEATWEAIGQLNNANIRPLLDPQPVEMAPGAVLLPAPLRTRRPGADPTSAMGEQATEGGMIRIGLAHGPIHGFGESEASPGVIAPDRDRTARLDYLALGDWHGQMRVSDRLWYSGSPETDRFKHDGPGACLVVEITSHGATPQVQSVTTGSFGWHDLTLDLLPDDDAAVALEALLPVGNRRDTLLRISARGRTTLSNHSALVTAAERLDPEFCYFKLETSELATEVEEADLDAIAGSGALRQAAETLSAEAKDAALAERDREVAAAALRRLHGLVVEAG